SDLDRHDYALLTSPCLFSIGVMSGTYEDDFDDLEEIKEGARLRLAVRLASNLEDVRILRDYDDWSPTLEPWPEMPTRPWQTLPSDEQKRSSRLCSLRHLQLATYKTVSRQEIHDWSIHTDFSVLQVLQLNACIDTDALDYLVGNCHFPSLRTLVLDLSTDHVYDDSVAALPNCAGNFLRSLPGLSAIKIRGELRRSIFNTLLGHHGAALRKLWILPDFDADRIMIEQDEVDQIRSSCPLLEHLALLVSRSQGDSKEVAIYTSLGAFSRLRTLFLELDVSENILESEDGEAIQDHAGHALLEDPSFDEFDQRVFDDFDRVAFGPRNGHVRRILINSALDKTLARDIFHAISSNSSREISPLQRLQLKVVGAGMFRDRKLGGDLQPVFEHIARSWLLERNLRDDFPNDVVATGLERESREALELSWNGCDTGLSPSVERVFRRIWPVSLKEGGDWHDDWYSLPLSQS
ncbi:MAG: hypothetical protein Q9181_007635, partial [Wetmoreana brouardii]